MNLTPLAGTSRPRIGRHLAACALLSTSLFLLPERSFAQG